VIGPLLELFWACVKIGCLAFGGGNAAIPLLEAEAVPRWVSQQEFGELVGLNFAFPGLSILKLAAEVTQMGKAT
jgi:chromate transporter